MRTCSESFCATARATAGVVKKRRKLKTTAKKMMGMVLTPTAARGAVPSRPTRAADQHDQQHRGCSHGLEAQ